MRLSNTLCPTTSEEQERPTFTAGGFFDSFFSRVNSGKQSAELNSADCGVSTKRGLFEMFGLSQASSVLLFAKVRIMRRGQYTRAT
jgi:hypothetical protein